MARTLYLTSYKRNGITYPLGGGGNFPVTVDLGPCGNGEDEQQKFLNKLSILREEKTSEARRIDQNIISLTDSSFLMSLSSTNNPSVPLLYYKE